MIRLRIRVRADQAETALADLLPLLAAGAEERAVEGCVEYSLYGPAAELPSREDVRRLAGDAVVDVVSEPVAAGWERRWHEFLRPVRAGRLVVRPPWVAGAADDLVIDPGVFFGAGTHPTTRLCLELLQTLPAAGSLCDWGAGTGVLAVAAARLGWGPVTAVEIDASALPVIEGNATRNGVVVTAVAGDRPVTARTVVANLPRAALMSAAIAAERAIASGMLAGEVGDVVAALDMREVERRVDGEWAAVLLS